MIRRFDSEMLGHWRNFNVEDIDEKINGINMSLAADAIIAESDSARLTGYCGSQQSSESMNWRKTLVAQANH